MVVVATGYRTRRGAMGKHAMLSVVCIILLVNTWSRMAVEASITAGAHQAVLTPTAADGRPLSAHVPHTSPRATFAALLEERHRDVLRERLRSPRQSTGWRPVRAPSATAAAATAVAGNATSMRPANPANLIQKYTAYLERNP